MIALNKKTRNDAILKLEKEFPESNTYKTRMMNWDDIRTCIANNIEIASHTMTHDSLITIKDIEDLKTEILQSKDIIAEKTKTRVNTFTFPNGLYNEQVLEMCRLADYSNLLTTKEELHEKKPFQKEEHNLIPRISIDKRNVYENIFKIHNFHNLHFPKKWN